MSKASLIHPKRQSKREGRVVQKCVNIEIPTFVLDSDFIMIFLRINSVLNLERHFGHIRMPKNPFVVSFVLKLVKKYFDILKP